jgi:hypothetical protein
MEPKELEGIWVCASDSDPGHRAPNPATLQESAGPGAAGLTHLPEAGLRSKSSVRGPSCLCL